MLSWLGDMKAYSSRIRFSWLAALAAASVGLSSYCFAQSAATPTVEAIPGINGKTDIRVRELPHKVFTTPFPTHGKTERRDRLEYRPPEQMAAGDRELAEANQAEIARRASLQGFDLGSGLEGAGSWGYEQAVCPVFPHHLVLEYSRVNGNGDVTLFSAVIPRGEGHVRVIPVRRRSYSLWTPAPSNALTINDFNHMIQEGQEGLNPDWLTLGLCYAALAGGHVRAALVPQSAADEVYPLFAPAKLNLTISEKSGAEILFVDVTPHSKAMNWNLNFDSKGRLLKVKHSVSGEVVEKPVRGAPVDLAAPGHS